MVGEAVGNCVGIRVGCAEVGEAVGACVGPRVGADESSTRSKMHGSVASPIPTYSKSAEKAFPRR